ncbi:hypothetical protein ABZX40_39165 [Streptomyces sp. NPDC004610]|uniref:hypothetical protein n=1 Tax=unclassified Streptomyces TaxID=2593676 RepID=UPI0033A92251
MGSLTRDDLGDSLRTVLGGPFRDMYGDGVVRAMSTVVGEVYRPRGFGSKFLDFVMHGIGDGVIGAGSEMIYNGITQGRLLLSGGGFLTSVTSERAMGISNSFANWAAGKRSPGPARSAHPQRTTCSTASTRLAYPPCPS